MLNFLFYNQFIKIVVCFLFVQKILKLKFMVNCSPIIKFNLKDNNKCVKQLCFYTSFFKNIVSFVLIMKSLGSF